MLWFVLDLPSLCPSAACFQTMDVVVSILQDVQNSRFASRECIPQGGLQNSDSYPQLV